MKIYDLFFFCIHLYRNENLERLPGASQTISAMGYSSSSSSSSSSSDDNSESELEREDEEEDHEEEDEEHVETDANQLPDILSQEEAEDILNNI